MQVAQMNMLRWSVGLILKDRMRNEQVWERVTVGELKGNMRETKERWLGTLL